MASTADGSSRGAGSGASPSAASASDVALVFRFWADFDLEGMRPKLDEMGLKVAEYQEEAMQNRKRLAESTKDFRKIHAEDTNTKAVGTLLKQYQEEIDRLTKRAKHSEGAFLNVYTKLFEAPDPAPALSMAFETASRVTDVEAQFRKVSAELAEYKAESTHIKNQDLTIRKLEEKVHALEAHAEDKDRQVQEARDRAVADADAARMAQMQQREEELTAMLAAAHSSLAAMQKLHQASQNQLFAIQSQSEEEHMGRQTELELASSELERAQERLAGLEREKQQLMQRLTQGEGGGKAAGAKAPAAAAAEHAATLEESLRTELGLQREVSARLRSEVTSLKRELDEAHSMWEARVEGLKATLAATEQHAHAVEQQLRSRPSVQQVEELRQQIRMLQAIGMHTVDADDDEDKGPAGPGPASGPGASGAAPAGPGAPSSWGGTGAGLGGSLEAALLQKNRHLEHELTMAKLRAVDGKTELDTALGRLGELEGQLSKQQQLIDKLEEDLVASRGAASGGSREGGQGQGQAGGRGQLSGLLLGARSSSTAAAGEGEEGEGEGASGQDASMLRVLCSQRDRFRHKAVELEEEVGRARAEASAAKSEAAAAKADNVALVERLRYVHGFRQKERSGSSGKGADVESGGDVEGKYVRIYEEGINPFKEFQGQQKERQKQRMGFVDRAMYKFGQLVFGSQGGRLFAFTYLVVLHLLVLGSLMRMTHHSSSQLYEHQQAVLEHRHDAMGVLHHEGGAGGIGSPALDSRLP